MREMRAVGRVKRQAYSSCSGGGGGGAGGASGGWAGPPIVLGIFLPYIMRMYFNDLHVTVTR